jgi:hypothetical protein
MRVAIHVGSMIMISLVLAGCTRPIIVKGPNFNSSTKLKYMIMPFGDVTEPKFRLQYPNAAETVRDAFESAFLETGIATVAYKEGRITEALVGTKKTAKGEIIAEKPSDTEAKIRVSAESQDILSKEGITLEQGIESGRQAGADAVLFGTVTAFRRGTFAEDYTTVGFSVKAIDVKTSGIMWKASLIQKTGWEYNYDPSMYAAELAKKLVHELAGKQ